MKKALLLPLALLATLLPASGAGATTHVVNMIGVTFSPAALTIDAGDTVQWVFPVSAHTVTSGTGAADPQAGVLFDHSGLSGLLFSYTFNTPGNYPYFCRPHEAIGMVGNITVNAPTPAPEEVRAESWGSVKNSYRDAIEDRTDED